MTGHISVVSCPIAKFFAVLRMSPRGLQNEPQLENLKKFFFSNFESGIWPFSNSIFSATTQPIQVKAGRLTDTSQHFKPAKYQADPPTNARVVHVQTCPSITLSLTLTGHISVISSPIAKIFAVPRRPPHGLQNEPLLENFFKKIFFSNFEKNFFFGEKNFFRKKKFSFCGTTRPFQQTITH